MNIKLLALERGLFCIYRRNPLPIKIYKLENYLNKSKERTKLIQALVYSMTTPLLERNEPVWNVLNNLYSGDKKYLATYYVTRYPKDINDLIVIDYSILESINKQEFIDNNPTFTKRLILELRRIYR